MWYQAASLPTRGLGLRVLKNEHRGLLCGQWEGEPRPVLCRSFRSPRRGDKKGEEDRKEKLGREENEDRGEKRR